MSAPHACEKAKKPPRPNQSTCLPTRVHLPKPVRFVTNNEEPQSKRRRISAACRTCQKRKIRCSGERPKCKTCLDSENECKGYVEQLGPNSKLSGGSKCRPGKLELSRDDNKPPVTSANVKGPTPGARTADGCSSWVGELGASKEAEEVQMRSQAPDMPVAQAHENNIETHRKCVPFFRYFGPTAIVPGLKRMVAPITESHSDKAAVGGGSGSSDRLRSSTSGNSAVVPFYEQLDHGPVSPMIKDLCETFFKHLGCNYPFLKKDRFMHDLISNKLANVLVNAVCALAARFSTNPALRNAGNVNGTDMVGSMPRSKYGQIFARRAMTALTETFACPSIAAVQASLLLAYEQFGSDRDSGLWVYLGLSIRMAQDLGMHKLEGLRFEGHLGPTPKTTKSGAAGLLEEQRRAEKFHTIQARTYSDPAQEEEIRRVEKERIDTFWAIFFLDRVVSSGTGRPASLRDKDIEISFPSQGEPDQQWPDPFPALIRIVHLYGRVANLLNNIQEVNQVTHDIMQQLVAAEDDLIALLSRTAIYTRLSPHLHFSAANFQYYLKHSQATNFILLHFWFHALIVLVHQPTLLDSFEGHIQQLFPNSTELSLSSAKTVADILSFAELLDNKSFIGNPFCSQPIYVAACAFLLESSAHTLSPFRLHPFPYDRPDSPFTLTPPNTDRNTPAPGSESETSHQESETDATKESLLAAAASRNYQRCYKALVTLAKYWAGARYIVTVLDQKAKGSLDPLLYTAEDLQGAVENPSAASLFGSPGWGEVPREQPVMSDTDQSAALGRLKAAAAPLSDVHLASKMDPSQAIGWALAGSADSADSHLSLLYQTTRDEVPANLSALTLQSPSRSGSHGFRSNNISSQVQMSHYSASQDLPTHHNTAFGGRLRVQIPCSTSSPNHMSNSRAVRDILSDSPTPGFLSRASSSAGYDSPTSAPFVQDVSPGALPQSGQRAVTFNPHPSARQSPLIQTDRFDSNTPTTPSSLYNDMIIESQDVDTNALGIDPMFWLDYMPQTFLHDTAAGPHQGQFADAPPSGATSESAYDCRTGKNRHAEPKASPSLT